MARWFSRKKQRIGHEEARRIQRAWWEWQQLNPGVPIFEARIDGDGSEIQWHGPTPDEIFDPPKEEE